MRKTVLALTLFAAISTADAASPLVGQAIGPMTGVRWLTPDRTYRWADHKLTLIRWWTTSCPHCSASVPALAGMWRKYRAKGLNFVAVFHQKGRRGKSDADLRAYLGRLQFDGTIARDDKWTKLQEVMRRGNLRKATSISVLVDDKGVVRWVHPGPRIPRLELAALPAGRRRPEGARPLPRDVVRAEGASASSRAAQAATEVGREQREREEKRRIEKIGVQSRPAGGRCRGDARRRALPEPAGEGAM